MTRFLRTASTRRLLAVIIGGVIVAAGGTAIAVAGQSGGAKPLRQPLASALRQGLAAPQIHGISARVSLTNNLIGASNFQGSDSLLQGAVGRLWVSDDHRLRLELQAKDGGTGHGDAQVVVNDRSVQVYDPMSNTVYSGTLPAGTGRESKQMGAQAALPSLGDIQSTLGRLAAHVNLSGAIPSNVAGQPTYTVRVTPKHDGGLLGAAEVAWDALRGVPLRIAVYASNSSRPVLELKATDIAYGPVKPSVFAIQAPAGAKVVKMAAPNEQGASAGADKRHHAPVTGVAAVGARVPFTLVAPRTLGRTGLPCQSVRLLDWGGTPAALVTYGENLGGIAVIEQKADAPARSPAKSSGQNGDQSGLAIPTVSIHGTSAQELATALGTVIRFTRGGVTYTVLGSVPPVAAELAAKAL